MGNRLTHIVILACLVMLTACAQTKHYDPVASLQDNPSHMDMCSTAVSNHMFTLKLHGDEQPAANKELARIKKLRQTQRDCYIASTIPSLRTYHPDVITALRKLEMTDQPTSNRL